MGLIEHVHAGFQLAPSSEYRSDSYPNLRPEGCAFRVYDDVIYKTVVDTSDNAVKEDNIIIQCVSGHTGCLEDKNLYSSIGEVLDCEDADNMFGSAEEEVLFETRGNEMKKKKKKKKREDGNGHDEIVNVVIGSAAILSIFATIFYYFFLSKRMMGKGTDTEQTPLLNDVGLLSSYN